MEYLLGIISGFSLIAFARFIVWWLNRTLATNVKLTYQNYIEQKYEPPFYMETGDRFTVSLKGGDMVLTRTKNRAFSLILKNKN